MSDFIPTPNRLTEGAAVDADPNIHRIVKDAATGSPTPAHFTPGPPDLRRAAGDTSDGANR